MKKKYFAFALLLIVLIAYSVLNKWLSYEDDPLTQATKLYPLGNNTPYVIVKTDGTGAGKISTPYIYAIIKPGESISSASLSCRRIGQSAVDLDQYINKEVYISGEYYMGTPLFIQKPDSDPYGLTTTQPVIKITNLTLVQ